MFNPLPSFLLAPAEALLTFLYVSGLSSQAPGVAGVRAWEVATPGHRALLLEVSASEAVLSMCQLIAAAVQSPAY